MGYEPKVTAGGNGHLGGNGTFPQIIEGLAWIATNRDQKDLEQKAAWEQYANAQDDAHSTADRAYTDSLIALLPNKQYVQDWANTAESDAKTHAGNLDVANRSDWGTAVSALPTKQYVQDQVSAAKPSIVPDPEVPGAYLVGE